MRTMGTYATAVACVLILAMALGCASRRAGPGPAAGSTEVATGGTQEPFTPMVDTSMVHSQAIAIASERFPNLHPIEVELDTMGDDTFTVTMVGEDRLVEVEVRGSDESIAEERVRMLEAEETGEYRLLHETIMQGQNTFAQAVEVAEQSYDPHLIRELELEMHGENLVMEVELRMENEIVEWVLDPETGEVTGREGGSDSNLRPLGPG